MGDRMKKIRAFTLDEENLNLLKTKAQKVGTTVSEFLDSILEDYFLNQEREGDNRNEIFSENKKRKN